MTCCNETPCFWQGDRVWGLTLANRWALQKAGPWLTLSRNLLVWRATMDFLWAHMRWMRLARAVVAAHALAPYEPIFLEAASFLLLSSIAAHY